MTWTRFMDMYSGGGQKEPYTFIYIEAPEDDAKSVFYSRYGHNPDRVSCTCCGNDYSIGEYATLEQATAFDRGCRYDDSVQGYVEEPEKRYGLHEYMPLDTFLIARKNKGKRITEGAVLVIRADEIQNDERKARIPEQGYVWVD